MIVPRHPSSACGPEQARPARSATVASSASPRRAALADAEALSVLTGELFPDACPSFMPRSAIEAFIAVSLSVEAFRDHLAHPVLAGVGTECSDLAVPSGTPAQRAVAPVGGVQAQDWVRLTRL